MRYRNTEGKETEIVVTVTATTKISVKLMRESLARYFMTEDVSVGSDMETDRHAKYRYDELLHGQLQK